MNSILGNAAWLRTAYADVVTFKYLNLQGSKNLAGYFPERPGVFRLY